MYIRYFMVYIYHSKIIFEHIWFYVFVIGRAFMLISCADIFKIYYSCLSVQSFISEKLFVSQFCAFIFNLFIWKTIKPHTHPRDFPDDSSSPLCYSWEKTLFYHFMLNKKCKMHSCFYKFCRGNLLMSSLWTRVEKDMYNIHIWNDPYRSIYLIHIFKVLNQYFYAHIFENII